MPSENSNEDEISKEKEIKEVESTENSSTFLQSQEAGRISGQEPKKHSLFYRVFKRLIKCTSAPLSIVYIFLNLFYSHFYCFRKAGFKDLLEISDFPKKYFDNPNLEELDDKIVKVIQGNILLQLFILVGELMADEIEHNGEAILKYFKIIFTFKFRRYEEIKDKIESVQCKDTNQTEKTEANLESNEQKTKDRSRITPKNCLFYICNMFTLITCFGLMSNEVEAIKANFAPMNYLLAVTIMTLGFVIFSLIFEIDQVVFIMRFFSELMAVLITLSDSYTVDQFYPVHYSQIDSQEHFSPDYIPQDDSEDIKVTDFFNNEILPVFKKNEVDTKILYSISTDTVFCLLNCFPIFGKHKVGVFPKIFYRKFYVTNSIDQGKLELSIILQKYKLGYFKYSQMIFLLTCLTVFVACLLYVALTYKKLNQDSSEAESIVGYGLCTYNYTKAVLVILSFNIVIGLIIKICLTFKIHQAVFDSDIAVLKMYPDLKELLIQKIITETSDHTAGIYPIYFPFYDSPSPYHRILNIEALSNISGEN